MSKETHNSNIIDTSEDMNLATKTNEDINFEDSCVVVSKDTDFVINSEDTNFIVDNDEDISFAFDDSEEINFIANNNEDINIVNDGVNPIIDSDHSDTSVNYIKNSSKRVG
ncbi:6318_t:CDS:1 [Cetraspora pellucida]|uniref:6318_t:CDS:1 n=2 Tax=Cetraspora pellucida TaxID=1433469 RepID=A0ACA9MDQ5_9GLOM|nr:6318_t:CDS:1 [Cetraspora pellucida]